MGSGHSAEQRVVSSHSADKFTWAWPHLSSLPPSPDSQVKFRYSPSSLPAIEMTGFSEALVQGRRLPV